MSRRIGPFAVAPIGLGCMNLSHAYAAPPGPEPAARLLLHALDAGVDLFDTAALYGFGANESLLGRVLSPHRARFRLASKCGMHGVDGQRVIDGRPASIRASVEASLKRLNSEVIDLLYLHRWDRKVPIEDSVGAMADLLRAGKVRALGLSEVSAGTLRRAHAVHPIAALQSEYSLWTRNPEIATLAACRELGVAFVAFSPLGRGFLAGGLGDAAQFDAKDIRRAMPRFQPDHLPANLRLFQAYKAIAVEAGMSPAQLALTWLLGQGDDVVVIPGTTSMAHFDDNLGALGRSLTEQQRTRLDRLINHATVSGARYSQATQAEIDTEEFPLSSDLPPARPTH